MASPVADLDMSQAVPYHYGKFPPDGLDYKKIVPALTGATAALARYDQMLKSMHNSEILLAPLRNQEAVVSSRMEGTISTLDEILRFEADNSDEFTDTSNYRLETLEVALYGRALRMAQQSILSGQPISNFLIRSAHRVLLGFGRGSVLSPGEFKTDQNYLADRAQRKIMFVPISPEQLPPGMDLLMDFIRDEDVTILVRTALAHLEFEALHPFKDGNGRIGRMLITLMLWHYGVVSAPHFYVSNFFEANRDEYIDRMRAVSKSGEWTEWAVFFLRGLETQAVENLSKAEEIRRLYEELKGVLGDLLSSKWSINALDYLFTRPIFRNAQFVAEAGIPAQTSYRIAKTLVQQGLIVQLEPASGQRSALYSFEPLLKLVRG